MRATSLVLIGVSQIHVVLNILINRNYSYCNTMYKWINKRFCLSVFLCQSEFREDFAACRSTFASIAPVLDAKGIVRAEGRIGQLPLHPDVCHPIILPGNSPLVELYARRKHIRYLHQGYRVVLANIAKEGIHIGNGKELLKSVAVNVCTVAPGGSPCYNNRWASYLPSEETPVRHRSPLWPLTFSDRYRQKSAETLRQNHL